MSSPTTTRQPATLRAFPRRVPVFHRRLRRIRNLSAGDRFHTLATDRDGVVRGRSHRGGPIVQFEGCAWPVEVHDQLLIEVVERVGVMPVRADIVEVEDALARQKDGAA